MMLERTRTCRTILVGANNTRQQTKHRKTHRHPLPSIRIKDSKSEPWRNTNRENWLAIGGPTNDCTRAINYRQVAGYVRATCPWAQRPANNKERRRRWRAVYRYVRTPVRAERTRVRDRIHGVRYARELPASRRAGAHTVTRRRYRRNRRTRSRAT